MHKLSQRQPSPPKKISNRDEASIERYIHDMKDFVQHDPEVIAKFKEYDVPLKEIWDVRVSFCKLDVSAKTKNMKIYLNEEMLSENSKVKDPTHYLVHELVHYLQQKTGKNLSKLKADDDYLDKPTEEEAFKTQIDFKKRVESPQEAENYVNNLLDHHDLHGKKREEKKEDLLEKD
jgi:hypothetical protein